MKPRWLSSLRDQLQTLKQGDLDRSLRVVTPRGPRLLHAGRELINLAGNDYLALCGHPHLKAAVIDAANRFGVGAGASRLVTGHHEPHEQVEHRFARFKHAEQALLLPTGALANLAVLTTLAQPGDLILIDKLCHASLIDAARYSGATVRVYPHLNTDKLTRLLNRPPRTPPRVPPTARVPRRFIVTDSVFSMDGDTADLPTLCTLAEQHDAILIVDEAHATGLFGPTGAGLCEHQAVTQRVDIVISTASKALGGLGGIVTARAEVIQTLINTARALIYTTAVPPTQAAAIDAALDVVRDEPWRRQRVLELAQKLRTGLTTAGCKFPSRTTPDTPIVPIIAGSTAAALSLSKHLYDHGMMAPAIRPPTVAPGAARVRLTVRADLEDKDIDHLIEAAAQWIKTDHPHPIKIDSTNPATSDTPQPNQPTPPGITTRP